MMSGLYHSRRQGRQHGPSVGVAEGFAACALGVRHHPKNIAIGIADPSNVVHRTIGVEFIFNPAIGSAVSEQDLIAILDGVQPSVVDGVVAFAVGNGDAQRLAIGQAGRHGGHQRLRAQQDIAANELSAFVVPERSGQQPCLAQHLKTIADAEDKPASSCMGMSSESISTCAFGMLASGERSSTLAVPNF